MLTPAVGIFIFCFFVVGVIAGSPEFHKPDGPMKVVPFWEMAFHHYNIVLTEVFSIPAVCLVGGTVNDFQDHQCQVYWTELLKSGGLAALPLAGVGLFLMMGLDALGATYKRAQKKIETGTSAVGGTVTNPPDAPSDFYSWFYCFRPIMVELSTKEQVKVYMPKEAPMPSPGTKFAVFEMGKSLGEKRRIGTVYAPHVAVIRG